MSRIAFQTTMPDEIRYKSSAIYHGEIENNQKWFDRNSIEIREIINIMVRQLFQRHHPRQLLRLKILQRTVPALHRYFMITLYYFENSIDVLVD